jgi:hypothetical protein
MPADAQDIFYINFGAWHRKNSADWATFIPALEALGKDYQVSLGGLLQKAVQQPLKGCSGSSSSQENITAPGSSSSSSSSGMVLAVE